ncbi:MAG: hypothetical protein LBQ66_02260 [Planctomycetaceae bacterium]|jgi:hypothetical protein|nr:hypothetical protein [Planctomycetaceae bacterium]
MRRCFFSIEVTCLPFTNTLSLSATAGSSILFYDPIEYLGYSQNLTIEINKAGQIGTVLFDTYQSNIYGNTTIYNGTLKLQNGAIYGANANAGTFELQENATLSVAGSGNAINAIGNVTLAGTLAIDLTGVTADSTDTALTLNGNVSTTNSNTVIFTAPTLDDIYNIN